MYIVYTFVFMSNKNVSYLVSYLSVMPTFYGDLQVIMFILLHLYCMYLLLLLLLLFFIHSKHEKLLRVHYNRYMKYT